MIGTRKITLFGLYILMTGGILLYMLFPSEAVRDHLSNRINQNVADAQVAIGSLRLRFPLSLSLGEVSVSKNGSVLFSVDRMRLSPKLLSLLSGQKAFKYRGKTYQGEFDGSLWTESDSDGYSASASGSFSEIQLGQVPVVESQSRMHMDGALAGSFQIDASSTHPATGSGNIVVSDCNLVLTETFSDIQRLLNIEQLNFERISADLYIEDGSLEIQNGELDGTQLKGRVSGSIFLDTPMSRSDLDLEIAVTPLLYSSLSEINELTLRVTGTFENPIISTVPTR